MIKHIWLLVSHVCGGSRSAQISLGCYFILSYSYYSEAMQYVEQLSNDGH